MAKPIVAMLTDFGTRDHYAGSLKGVVLTLWAIVVAGKITLASIF